MKITIRSIDEIAIVTDFVANGSFASLKKEVKYLDSPGYAILVRFTDYTNNWNSKYKYVSESAYNFLSKSKVFPGDLVIANVGDPGKLFLVPDLKMPMTLGPNCILVRPKVEGVSTYYLSKYLSSPLGQKLINKIVSKTAQSKFNKTSFRKIKIPLPPLDDQVRIATLLTCTETLIAKRKESIKALDELLKSTFLKMFEKFIGEDGEEKLGDCLTLQQGYAFKSNEFIDDGVPVIKIGTVNKGFFDYATLSFIKSSYTSKIRRFEIFPGDLLLSLTGTVGKDDYGNTCFVPLNGHFNKYLLNQRVGKLCPDTNKITLCFLDHFFRLTKTKTRLIKNNRGVRQANLSNTDIYSLSLNVPPLPLQNQFAAIVEKIEFLKSKYTQSLTELENLYGSLSQRAFKGELDLSRVPIDSDVTPEPNIGKVNITMPSFKVEGKASIHTIFTEIDLIKYLKKKKYKIFSFEKLWRDIEMLTPGNILHKTEIQKLLLNLLDADNPIVEQVFEFVTVDSKKENQPIKQIAFKVKNGN